MWGADTVEVPRGDALRAADARVITSVEPAPAAASPPAPPTGTRSRLARRPRRAGHPGPAARRRVRRDRRELLRRTTGGPMPAGSIIFPNDPNTVAALEAAGEAGGLTFQRNAASQAGDDAAVRGAEGRHPRQQREPGHQRLRSTRSAAIFGADAIFVSVSPGANSIQNAPTDPLLGDRRPLQHRPGLPGGRLHHQRRRTGRDVVGDDRHHHDDGQQQPDGRRDGHDRGVPEAGYNGTFR